MGFWFQTTFYYINNLVPSPVLLELFRCKIRLIDEMIIYSGLFSLRKDL